MKLILKFLLIAGAVFLIAEGIPGIEIEGGWATVALVTLAWSLISLVVKPILSIVTLPLTFLTLGLFSFVLNALLFVAMEYIVPGFSVDGFVPALIGSILLSFVTWAVEKLL
jgi:putative membrane protein